MAKNDPTLDHLAAIPLFSGCSQKELKHLRSLCEEVTVAKGKVLVKQGAVGFECFVIVEGLASVSIDDHVVTTLGAGAYFGELALLDKQPRSATVTAVSDMTVLVLGPREFSSALETVPGLSQKLLSGMARRVRETNKQLSH
jgi:CRP/FNR family transcriptional regulator, cyclic AMP receptor protein